MQDRVRQLNNAPVKSDARYVLYWSQMNRRTEWNHALSHAVQLATSLDLPVLFYEGLTCSYPCANDRMHTFVLEGVPDTARALKDLGIGYLFYLRRTRSDPNNVVYHLAEHAAAVVTDDYPTFVARMHNGSVPARLPIAYIVVDSSCVVPMSCFEKHEYAAYTIRPKIQRLLAEYLKPVPAIQLKRRWREPIREFHTDVTATNIAELVASCEIDHSVAPSLSFTGGPASAQNHLRHFLNNSARRYAAERNEPSAHVTSSLSPYLHFGHVSSLEVALAAQAYPEFLEELIVRRELAFNHARFAEHAESLDTLPQWAKASLQKHARDPRNPCYRLQQLERAETYDDLWNATQRELLLRGKIHGYYRMYWGKKILEWSSTPSEAVESMIYLHDRYALDGRDPNTYTNILWCLGLHDRPFSERPIFGQVRYMSYEGMKRKTNVAAYIKEIDYLSRTGKDPFRL